MMTLVNRPMQFLEGIIKDVRETSLDNQQKFVRDAQKRLRIYDDNLKIAETFHQVDEPKLKLAERFEKLEALLFDNRIEDFEKGLQSLVSEHQPSHINESLSNSLLRIINEVRITNEDRTGLIDVILRSLQGTEGRNRCLIFQPDFKLEQWLLKLNQIPGINSDQTQKIFASLSKEGLTAVLINIANRSRPDPNAPYDDGLIQEAKLFGRLINLVKDDKQLLTKIYAVIACRASANRLILEPLESLIPESVIRNIPLEKSY